MSFFNTLYKKLLYKKDRPRCADCPYRYSISESGVLHVDVESLVSCCIFDKVIEQCREVYENQSR